MGVMESGILVIALVVVLVLIVLAVFPDRFHKEHGRPL